MTEIQINKLKKRDVVTQLEKLVPISRPSLLKLSKKELVGLLKEKIDNKIQSDPVKHPETESIPKKVKSKRPNKKRLLDFSSDEEEDDDEQTTKQNTEQQTEKKTEPTEIIETIDPVKEPENKLIGLVPDTQVAKKEKKKKPVVETKQPEQTPELPPRETKLMKEIKSEIKTLMKDFSSHISKTILEFKKTEDQTVLIDTHNELRSDYESEVKLILDENKSKVTDALLDYVDSLFTTQFNRVDRLL